jgi:hypothetical protein
MSHGPTAAYVLLTGAQSFDERELVPLIQSYGLVMGALVLPDTGIQMHNLIPGIRDLS